MAVPVFVGGAVPKTAPVTGAGASLTLWVNSIGWRPSPSSPRAVAAPIVTAMPSADANNSVINH